MYPWSENISSPTGPAEAGVASWGSSEDCPPVRGDLHLLRGVPVPSVVLIFAIVWSPQPVYLPFLFKVLPTFLQHSFSDWFPGMAEEERGGDTTRQHEAFSSYFC